MKKICFFILLFEIFISNNVYSQNIKKWDRAFGGDLSDGLSSLQQTYDGGYILGGTSLSGISGDKTQNNNGGNKADYWLVKTDENGIKKWDKTFGGNDVDAMSFVQQTSDSGYIMGGSSVSGINGDKTETGRGQNDYWIVKTDSIGVKQWDKTYGGAFNDQLTCLQQTSDGGYILGGFSFSQISGDKSEPSRGVSDFWVIKIDQTGVKQWDKRFGASNNDFLMSIDQTADGGYVLGGTTGSELVEGDKSEPQKGAAGTTDYWIVKINSVGTKEWDKAFADVDYLDGNGQARKTASILSSVEQTKDGGYILGGISEARSGGFPYLGDYWIVKTDPNGIKQWDKRFGGPGAEDDGGVVKQTRDLGFLISGTSYSGAGKDKSESNSSNEETWVIKTDAFGIKQWDKTLFTRNLNWGEDDECGYAIETKDGCFVLANSTPGLKGGDKTDTTRGSDDFWMLKWCCDFSTAALSPNVTIVNGGSTVLTASGGDSYLWTSAESLSCNTCASISVSPKQKSNYKVIITNNLGCSKLDSVQVTLICDLTKLALSNNITIEKGNSTIITTSGGTDYLWSSTETLSCNTCSSLMVSPLQKSTYTLIITDNFGCSKTDSVEVMVITDSLKLAICNDIFIPDVFSPNNDGENDSLYVRGACLKNAKFILYDRWGVKVFETENVKAGWDGRYNGKELNTGIYAFFFQGKQINKLIERKGLVSLIR